MPLRNRCEGMVPYLPKRACTQVSSEKRVKKSWGSVDGRAPESSCRLGVADIARISSRYLTVLPRKAACAAREWRGYIPARTTSEIFYEPAERISNLNLNLNYFTCPVKGKIRHSFADGKLYQTDQRLCAASCAARS